MESEIKAKVLYDGFFSSIPDLALRLKIAGFFGVDSSLIWRNEDIYYIREKIKEQLRTGEQK